MTRELFDCTPRMAAKLARCEAMAREQYACSRAEWKYRSPEDIQILRDVQSKLGYSLEYIRTLNA